MALGVWSLAFVALRSWLVVSLSDVFLYGEEYAKGTAAKAMLDGVPLAHWQLAYHPYEGGGFVTSHLDALVFALIGPSLLAQKIVALGFGLAVLCAGVRFCGRWFGAQAAHAFAALYVFAPATVQKLSLLNLGIHYQALLFSLLVLHFALRAGLEQDSPPRIWFAFGLAAGFGFYFSYTVALSIAPAVGWLAWSARRRLGERARWALLGAVVGLLPLGYMAWHTGSEVFNIHGAEVAGAEDDVPKFEALVRFWTSVTTGRDAWDLAGVFVLPLSALLGLCFAWRSKGDARVALGLVLAAFALFLASYLGSTFTIADVDYYFRLNRLCPAWLAGVLLASAGFARFAPRGPRRLPALAALVLAVATGADDARREADAGAGGSLAQRWEILSRFKGYDYRYWLGKVLPRTKLSRVECARIGLSFQEDARDWLAACVGEQVWLDFPGTLDEAIAEALSVDPSGGLVRGFGPLMKRKFSVPLRERAELVLARTGPERAWLEEAIGRGGSRFIFAEDVAGFELTDLRGLQASDALWRGFGWRLFEALGNHEPGEVGYWQPMLPPLWAKRSRAVEFVAREDPVVAAAILAGYDAARRARALP